LGYLTVAAVITTGVLALFGPSFSNAKAQSLASEVTSFANDIRDLYASQNSYSNVSIGTLVQAHAVPPTLKVNGSGASATLSNTWGGAVTLNPESQQVQLQYSNVPSDVCRRVLVSGGDWAGIEVNNESVQNPPNLAQAYAACNNAAGNTISWAFQ